MRDFFRYIDEHPGTPLALLHTVFTSLVIISIFRTYQPVGAAYWLVVTLYLSSVLMAATLGWMLNSFICGLEDRDNFLLALLGFDSWVVVYDIKGRSAIGQIEMTK